MSEQAGFHRNEGTRQGESTLRGGGAGGSGDRGSAEHAAHVLQGAAGGSLGDGSYANFTANAFKGSAAASKAFADSGLLGSLAIGSGPVDATMKGMASGAGMKVNDNGKPPTPSETPPPRR